MSTVTKIGPLDRGRPMTWKEFEKGDFQEGYHYELIEGKLYVSPAANPPEDILEKWLFGRVYLYSLEHRKVINYLTNKARVFIPGLPRVTAPEPDLAAYRDYPLHRPFRRIRWQRVSPFLVGEVVSPGDPKKDLVRNVDLYLRVPTIQEYWLVDGRKEPERPQLIVRQRQGGKWRTIEVSAGETYTTRLLPGFELVVNPRV